MQLDIKTVRRALEQPRPRVRSVDPWREQITQRLDRDQRLTAKRIRRLLLPLAGPIAARTVRRYVLAPSASTVRRRPTCTAACLPAARVVKIERHLWRCRSGG